MPTGLPVPVVEEALRSLISISYIYLLISKCTEYVITNESTVFKILYKYYQKNGLRLLKVKMASETIKLSSYIITYPLMC